MELHDKVLLESQVSALEEHVSKRGKIMKGTTLDSKALLSYDKVKVQELMVRIIES